MNAERRVMLRADGTPIAICLGLAQVEEGYDVDFASRVDQVARARMRPRVVEKTGIAAERLVITGEGLFRSYGIFGRPGSGKTFLLKHLLRQILTETPEQPRKPFGALILDPKAALRDDVRAVCREANRELTVIAQDELTAAGDFVDPLDCHLRDRPHDLGKLLVLAARASGVDAREPYWLQVAEDLLGAVLDVQRRVGADAAAATTGKLEQPTIRSTIDWVIGSDFDISPASVDRVPRSAPRLGTLLAAGVRRWRDSVRDGEDASRVEDLRQSLSIIARHLGDEKERRVVCSLLSNAFRVFLLSEMRCYSPSIGQRASATLYERILDHGEVVLVSEPRKNLIAAKAICTLVKCVFQRAVLDRHTDEHSKDTERPVLFMADEFSDIATDVPGEAFGDSEFFQLMREYHCMGLVATQSLPVLKKAIGDQAEALLSNLAATIYMPLSCGITAEFASKQAGEALYQYSAPSLNIASADVTTGMSQSISTSPNLQSSVLLSELEQGEGVAVGTLDGKRAGIWRFRTEGS